MLTHALAGFTTLAIDLGERSDEHSRAALNALPSYPLLNGWYKDRKREPHEQPRIVQSDLGSRPELDQRDCRL